MYDTPTTPRNNRAQQLDLGAQVAARPLLALGAAMVAGYLLGRRESQAYGGAASHVNWDSGASSRLYPRQSTSDLFAPVRDEIEQIQAAAMTVAKQMLRELTHGNWDQLLRSAQGFKRDRGLIDPNAGRDYANTYHSPDDTKSR